MEENKNIIFIFLICLFAVCKLYGQGDVTSIGLQVIQPKGLDINNATQILQKRLEQAVVLNDFDKESSPFLLETEILLISCQSTPSTPTQVIAEIEIICSITDKIKDRTIQQVDFQFKGIDLTRDKAIISAIKQLQVRNPRLKKFISVGKEKLIEEYLPLSQGNH